MIANTQKGLASILHCNRERNQNAPTVFPQFNVYIICTIFGYRVRTVAIRPAEFQDNNAFVTIAEKGVVDTV